MEWIRDIHIGCVGLTIGFFMLRGIWMIRNNPLLQAGWVRTSPHFIDSVLFISGVSMAIIAGYDPLEEAWLGTKLLALLAYIALGSIAIRRGRDKRMRVIAWVLAMFVFVYMLGVAFQKTPASWLYLAWA